MEMNDMTFTAPTSNTGAIENRLGILAAHDTAYADLAEVHGERGRLMVGHERELHRLVQSIQSAASAIATAAVFCGGYEREMPGGVPSAARIADAIIESLDGALSPEAIRYVDALVSMGGSECH